MYSYQYPRAAITTDAIVFVKGTGSLTYEKEISNDKAGNEENHVLLIQRGHEPFKNLWALPGGFIEMGETLETACKRELNEETGLKVNKMAQFRTYDAIARDPRHRTISVVYYCQLEKREKVKGGDDAAKADWFAVSTLPELAFDHKHIIEDFFEMY